MGIDVDNLFAGMAKAEIFGKGSFMGEGVFEIETKDVFVKEGFKGKSFICEFTILESNNPAHAVGSSGSYVLKFENKYTFGNASELVMALLGFENTRDNQANADVRALVQEVTAAACGSEKSQKALGEGYSDGMLKGVRLRLETKKTGTQKGGEYTVHKWSPIAAPTQAAA